MNILQTLQQLRDDLKSWVTTNLNTLNAKIDEKTILIDNELDSDSTNPVQNKAIATEIADINKRVGNTSVSAQINNAVDSIPKFSGDYNDLINAPNISEDDSGNMVIVDESGNIIFKADADGMHTTTLTLNGEAAATEKYVNEAISNIDIPKTDLTGYATEDFVSSSIETAKTEISESIVSDSEEWKVVDNNGNIIFQVNTDGAHTTDLTLNGESVTEKISSHTEDDTIHVTSEDKENWNNKVDKEDGKVLSSNDFTDEFKDKLENLAFEETDPTVPAWAKEETKPSYTAEEVGLGNVDNTADADKPVSTATQNALDNLKDELSESIVSSAEEWTIVDNNGNIVATISANGLETTSVTTQNVIVNGVNIIAELENRIQTLESRLASLGVAEEAEF